MQEIRPYAHDYSGPFWPKIDKSVTNVFKIKLNLKIKLSESSTYLSFVGQVKMKHC